MYLNIANTRGWTEAGLGRASLNFPRMTFGSRAVHRASHAAPAVLVATSMQETQLFPRKAATTAAIFVSIRSN